VAPEGHRKKQGTPTMGGLIVVVGFLSISVRGVIAYATGEHFAYAFTDLCVFGLFLGFALIGFIDDFVVPRVFVGKRGLGWKQKILMQLSVAWLCAYNMAGGFTVQMLGMIFLILFFSNAYNFSDGLDALASLLLIGLVGGLLFIAKFAGEWGLSRYLFALLGSILPFLYLNKPKAKVFMGDVGSLPIGAVLGLIVAAIAFPPYRNFYVGAQFYSIRYIVQGPPKWPYGYLSLFIVSGMMIVELVPVPLQILSVKLRKKKLFSFTPIHHALPSASICAPICDICG
jgi:phospho-N-acetylmuramoyl-pentapeptide-transferase